MFHFDPETHVYTLNGAVIPSVTQLLKPLTDYDQVPEFLLQKAADRGKAVHEACSYFATGQGVDEEQYTAEEWAYFLGFKEWFYEEGGKLFTIGDERLVSEIPMAHTRLKYGVTPDLIIDGVAVIEIKTRAYNKIIDPLQLTAQEEAWITNGGKKIPKGYPKHVLELRKDGTYRFYTAHHSQAWSKFRYLLEHHWKCREYETNIEKWRKAA